METKKKRVLIVLALVGIVLFVGILTVINKLKPAKEVIANVNVVAINKGDVEQKLDTTGTVKSMKSKTFFSPVNAKINELNFESGDSVKKGTQLIVFDLKDLEKDNKKVELNILSGQYDYKEAVNNANKGESKRATAQANAANLQAAVDDWQNYVNDLQAQILQVNEDAKFDAQIDAQNNAAEQQAAIIETESAIKEKTTQVQNLYAEYIKANSAWENKTKDPNATQEDLTALSDVRDDKQLDWEQAKADLAELEAYLTILTSGSGGYDQTTGANTTWLQQELERAGSKLGELKGELASEKAIAESDPTTLSTEAKEKMKIGTNLNELEAKTLEELIAEGKRGIQAEFTGVVSDTKVVNGATVGQGLEMFTLQSTEDVSVQVKISKYDYDKVKEGQKAVITMADSKYDGTVTKIDRIAVPDEKGNPVLKATVHIDNPDQNIFIGVEAKVTIQAAEAKNVPLVPTEVVNVGNEGSFCYVIEDGVIVKRDIETGVSSASFQEVKSGLKDGDLVLTDIGMYQEGDKVTGVEAGEGALPTDGVDSSVKVVE